MVRAICFCSSSVKKVFGSFPRIFGLPASACTATTRASPAAEETAATSSAGTSASTTPSAAGDHPPIIKHTPAAPASKSVSIPARVDDRNDDEYENDQDRQISGNFRSLQLRLSFVFACDRLFDGYHRTLNSIS